MEYQSQKILMVDSWVLARDSKMLLCPRSLKIDPSAGFLKYLSRLEYIVVYSASFEFAYSRSLFDF